MPARLMVCSVVARSTQSGKESFVRVFLLCFRLSSLAFFTVLWRSGAVVQMRSPIMLVTNAVPTFAPFS